MAYVPVPKDLSRIKTKVAFNLTKRQLIFFAAALLVGLPLFFLLKGSTGTSLAAFVMILVMLPCFLFAMYEKHGQPLETLIKNIIQTKFIRPKERPYNASTGLGGNGALPAPILVVKEGDMLDGLFIEAWCSQGAYFLYVPTDDPYAELLPILRETGIDAATVSTPTVAATFDKMLHHLTFMLMIWGVQALVLLIGLFCLILFGARLYCDNYRDRIACRLIEGHSLLSCIRTHLVLTVLYYGAVAAGLLLLKLAIELDYNILLGTLLAELLITLLACGSIARKNLYQIVKGAEA